MIKQRTLERIHEQLSQLNQEALEGLLHFLETLPKEDETAYLLRNPANGERLLRAVKNIEARQNLVQRPLTDLPSD